MEVHKISNKKDKSDNKNKKKQKTVRASHFFTNRKKIEMIGNKRIMVLVVKLSNCTPCQHYTNNTEPKFKEFLESKGIEYVSIMIHNLHLTQYSKFSVFINSVGFPFICAFNKSILEDTTWNTDFIDIYGHDFCGEVSGALVTYKTILHNSKKCKSKLDLEYIDKFIKIEEKSPIIDLEKLSLWFNTISSIISKKYEIYKVYEIVDDNGISIHENNSEIEKIPKFGIITEGKIDSTNN